MKKNHNVEVTISPIKKILEFFILLLGFGYMDVEVMLLLLLLDCWIKILVRRVIITHESKMELAISIVIVEELHCSKPLHFHCIFFFHFWSF